MHAHHWPNQWTWPFHSGPNRFSILRPTFYSLLLMSSAATTPVDPEVLAASPTPMQDMTLLPCGLGVVAQPIAWQVYLLKSVSWELLEYSGPRP